MLLLNLFNSSNLLVVLISIVVYLSVLFIVMPAHEFAHAWAAKSQGDYTAYHLKRYTLAPFAHIDTKGFLFLVLFGFGWAKPVPVDPRNYKHGRRSEVLVSLAGIIANLIQGILFCGLYVAFSIFVPQTISPYIGYAYTLFFYYGMIISFSLAFFNLLPMYPLDGFRVVEAVTKPNNSFVTFMKRHSFIMFLLFYFILSSLYFSYIVYPIADGVLWLWQKFFGLFV